MATFQEQALELLAELYEVQMKENYAVIHPAADPRGFQQTYDLGKYLEELGFIKVAWTMGGHPSPTKLTAYGINFIESPPVPSPSEQPVTINIGGDNAGIIAGHTAQNIHLDNSITWQSIREEVSKHELSPEDQDRID